MATGQGWTLQALTLTAGLVFLLHLVSSEDYRSKNCKPPSLSKQGDDLEYFIVNEEVHIFCIAEGNKTLEYSWLKNDEPLDFTSEENSGRIVMRRDGTLVFIDPKEEDAGYYQCKVVNQCGTSLSLKTHLLHARADPFPLLDKPSEVKGVVGTYLKLKCDPPASTPRSSITWIVDESRKNTNPNQPVRKPKLQSIELTDRVTMDYEGNLHITDLRQEDAQDGKPYICQAENLFTRSSNKGADKIIKVTGQEPTMQGVKLKWHSETNTVALQGYDHYMKCIFAGHPTPKVSWRRLDGEMNKERTTLLGHELLFKNIRPSDAGRYVCEGRNELDSDSKEFYLTVDAYPYVLNPPVDKTVGPEEDEQFSCKAYGRPEPVVEWFINGKPIDEVKDPKRTLKDNVLYFSKLEQADSQVVQCNVSNPHGYRWFDASLFVQAEKPSISQKPLPLDVVAEKKLLHIPCTVRGRPHPKVRWFKGAQALEGDRYDIDKNGHLEIKVADRKDSGRYKCEAENKFGKEWAFGNIEVREATEILQAPQSQNVTASSNVTFKCGAKTDPKETAKLKYKWFKDGKELDTNSSRITIYEKRLVIRDVSSKDTASYTCEANNGLDKDTAIAELRVEAVPDAPGNVTLATCQTTDAKITWTFTDSMSNFLPMEKFVVEYRTTVENVTGNWQEGTQALPTDREAIINLSPWAEYTFRVRAANTMGISKPSMATTPMCQTLKAAPDKNPGKVETDERHTGFLVIKWEPMKLLDLNAPNFTYIVEYQKQGDTEFTDHRVEDYRSGEYKVAVDDVYQAYTVRVRAENSVGKALKNPPTVTGYSGQGVPLVVPENFELDNRKNVTATSAWFKWDAVNTSVEAMQGKFAGYKIRFWKVGQKETTLQHHLVEPKVSSRRRRRRRQSSTDDDEDEDGKVYGVVANLPSFSEIGVDVVAINEFFESNGSDVVTIKTPEGVPGPVEYFKAISRGSHHFVLEWATPKQPNGIIRKYEISYSRLQGIDLEPRVLAFPGLSPETQRVVLRGLQPNSAYQIYIRAHTDEGPGTEYPIDLRTHSLAAELARPVILDVMAGETDANVTFEVPTPQSGSRLGQIYRVWYKSTKEDTWNEHEEKLGEGETWLTLNHLEPSTQYEVKVTAQAHEKDSFTDSDPYPFRTSGVGATKATFLTAAWFIGMMVAIIILLILLCIVCIIKRNRGDNYPVQEKERLRGTYDEQPDHFNGFGKVEENGLGGSAGSLDQEKLPLDAESDSLDYGDDDASKFNEDGSFIGQYGRGEKTGDSTNASSIV